MVTSKERNAAISRVMAECNRQVVRAEKAESLSRELLAALKSFQRLDQIRSNFTPPKNCPCDLCELIRRATETLGGPT